MLYVLVLWALTELDLALGYPSRAGAALTSLLLVIAVPLADAGLRGAVRAFASSRAGAAGHAYGRVAIRAGRILLALLVIVLFGWLWGIDLFDMAAGGLGERVVATLVDLGLTCWSPMSAGSSPRPRSTAGSRSSRTRPDRREVGGEGGGRGRRACKTLLPLFRKFLMVTLATMVVMLVLSSLGVDIGPLLAGAGVVGIAIGFGAQTLVARHRLRRVLSARRCFPAGRVHRRRRSPRHGRADLDPLAAAAPPPRRAAHRSPSARSSI